MRLQPINTNPEAIYLRLTLIDARSTYIIPVVTAKDMIREPILRELIPLSSDIAAIVRGRERGYAVHFRVGRAEKTLATTRGEIRLFASLDTAGAFVKDLGIKCFEVDTTGHRPGRLRGPRPDRAEALRLSRTKLRQQQLELQP